MKWIYSDGGRSKYFKGEAGDCVTRAICNATGMDYKEVYDLVNYYIKKESLDERYVSNARTGVSKEISRKLLEDLGWKWHPTMKFGEGCKVHLKEDELPKGTLIVSVSKHLTCVKDGVIYDTFSPCRNGNGRCVYGYFAKEK